jgi:hypothetical protein
VAAARAVPVPVVERVVARVSGAAEAGFPVVVAAVVVEQVVAAE